MTKQIARVMRKNLTAAERVLWYNLRDRRLGSWKFRRQHPIGPYIVDFVCLEKRLVVEVDGSQHSLMIAQDANRTEYLQTNGYKVLRFWNNEVLRETEAVVEMILTTIEERVSPSP